MNSFENLEHLSEIETTCPVHQIPLLYLDRPLRIKGEDEERKLPPFCPKCVQESIEQAENELTKDSQNRQVYLKTYDVLNRDSRVPKELKDATFENFLAETPEENQLLAFAKEQVQKYLNGMIGNTLITGNTGIGKSHLSYAMAKAINEGYRAKDNPKSVLFVSLTEIIKEIKEGWKYDKGANLTEHAAVRKMQEVDYLFLDDLGAKNATISSKSDWEQDLLFDILNNREITIINTNLNSDELKKVYNDRNYSRILKGLEGNSFKAFTIRDKRYTIQQLKAKIKR